MSSGKLLASVSLTALLALALALPACGQSAPSAAGAGGLRVLVLGADKGVLAGAKVVSNTQPSGQLKVTGISGNDGTVLFQDITPGAYSFYISVANYEQQDFAITVRAGATVSINVTMQRVLPPSSSASLSPLPSIPAAVSTTPPPARTS
jgi:hypothetical protein